MDQRQRAALSQLADALQEMCDFRQELLLKPETGEGPGPAQETEETQETWTMSDSEDRLKAMKRLLCDWLDRAYANDQDVRCLHARGTTRQGNDPASMSPEYAPDGREAVVFHNCGDTAGLLGLLRESGFG